MRDRIEGLDTCISEKAADICRSLGIPYNSFSKEDIRRYLGIPYKLPPLGKDDIFKRIVNDEKVGNLDMDVVIQVIEKEGMNWANNPEDNTIPRMPDNVILNARATA
ncbi:hypothetical protein PIB30_053784 [Stylosanthes scabra]|uniref:Uncharacterized protein n=1 Tax=Stylosanthes scabra TaxID=79078 RepID=A0ABU6VJJ5_9FABA|nr:hypothetical protein [Stylosanthes scabra]